MCDLVNHTRFPKEDRLPDWVCRDKHGNKGDRVEHLLPIWKFEVCYRVNFTFNFAKLEFVGSKWEGKTNSDLTGGYSIC
jgi:hypothetical protein